MRIRRGTSASFWKKFNGGQTYLLVDLRNKNIGRAPLVDTAAQSITHGPVLRVVAVNPPRKLSA